MLLVHPVLEVGKALPAIIGAFLAGHGSGDDSSGSRWSLGIAALVILFALLRWVTTRYRITPEQIQLRYGLLRRRTMAAPLDRVRTVDVTAHVLHRALGLARVSIGTGTSDRKGRNALVLDGLGAGPAAALRAELLHRSPAAPGPGPDLAVTVAAAPAVPVEYELARLNWSWARYAPFTLTGAVAGLALLGVGWRIVTEGHVDVGRLGPYRAAARRLGDWPLGVSIVLVAAGVVVFVALASTIGYVLAFAEFGLTRHSGGSLRVSRGLLTSRATSIERRRLHGIELSEPLLLRLVGGARCIAVATGLRVGRGAERGGGILLPPAPRAEAVRVGGAVLESAGPMTARLIAHPPAALRRRLGRSLAAALMLAGGFAALVLVAGWPYWLLSTAPGVLVSFAVALGVDRYRALGHAFVAGYVVGRFGSIVRRRTALAADGVIGWNLRSTLFQRRAGLTTLVATTAAGRQRCSVVDVGSAEAVRFADACTPGLLSEFLA
jgi:putative membrane protein